MMMQLKKSASKYNFCNILHTQSDFDRKLSIITTRKHVNAGSWDSDMIPQNQFAPTGEDKCI